MGEIFLQRGFTPSSARELATLIQSKIDLTAGYVIGFFVFLFSFIFLEQC